MLRAHFKQKAWTERLRNYIPKSVLCLKGYTLSTFWADLVAGTTVGVLAFPLAMAYAIGAGISPERGLFTAIIGGFLISLLSGSRVQIGGPAGAFIVVLYDILIRHGFDSLVIATLMAGVILIIFGFAGLGTFIKYIPYPVITGLTTGIAIVIFSSQIKDFFGLQMGDVPVNFLDKWGAYAKSFFDWNPMAFAIGFGCLALIIYFRRVRPQFPAALIALFLASLITYLFNLDIATIGSTYGAIPRSLPHPTFPHISFEQILTLLPDALTIALLAAIESLLSAVVSEGMTGWRYQSNCELVAQGIANIGSVIFGGIPATGAVARTAANVKSGARTPIAGMIHATVIFLIMISLAPFASKIPLAALSAVLVMIAWNMSEIHHFLHLFTAPKKDIIVLVTVFILTVLINITVAVQIGMILAAFLFMKQMSDLSDVVSIAPLFEETPQEKEELYDPEAIHKKEVPKDVEVYEINGPFFFGVADRLKNLLNQLEQPPKVFILRMRKVPAIDASGMHALEEFYLECKRQRTLLLLSGVKKHPLKDLRRFHLDELLGEQHIFVHISAALAFARDYLRTLPTHTP